MAEGVEVACAALGVEGLERLKSLVTWQRSRIAQLAIQIRSSEQSMESHESCASNPSEGLGEGGEVEEGLGRRLR